MATTLFGGATVSEKVPDHGPSRKRRRTPTIKQDKFSRAYVAASGNGVAAAREAGYRGNAKQLAVQACRNLNNPNVRQTIAAMVDALLEPAVLRVAEAMDATRTRSMLSKDGEIVCTAPEPDHRIRLGAIEFLFHLRSKCGPFGHAEGEERVQGKDAASREEAIEAAKECLETFAPHLLAGTAMPVEAQDEPPEESSGGEK
jgi:hypothetical protein